MGIKLKNSPILEAVCEFRFKDSTDDLTIYGSIHNELKGIYPNKKKTTLKEIKLASKDGKTVAMPNEIELQQFINSDNTSLIQVGKNILTVNKLKPYSTWNEFGQMIKTAYDNYIKITGLSTLERIGLRYINRIEFAESFIKTGEYFKLRPEYNVNALGEEHGPFMVGVRFFKNQDCDNLKIELTTGDPTQGYQFAFILDIDYFTLDMSSTNTENALIWVNNSHSEVENAFFSCITEKMMEKFSE
jgi:uncharacterized protein (TIGR04255 family)